jgi:hypothetical protein
MKIKQSAKEINVLYACIAVLGIAALWSLVSHRPLMSEGAHWYFNIFQWRGKFNDFWVFRYFDFLIQAPAIVVLRLFGDTAYDLANQAAIWLLSFAWSMYVFFSLFISNMILRKYKRQDLLAFQIVGMLSAYMQASGFAIGLALPAMYCFWPLFYFFVLTDGTELSDYIWFSVMAVTLAVCYEATVIFFIFLGLVAFTDLVHFKKHNRRFLSYVIFVCTVLAIILAVSILRLPTTETGPFWDSFFANLGNYRIFGLVIAAMTLSVPFFSMFEYAKQKNLMKYSVIIFALVAGYFGYLIYLTALKSGMPAKPYPPFTTYDFYPARTTALPVTTIIAFIGYFFIRRGPESGWFFTQVGRFFTRMLFAFTVMIAMIDVLLTNEWRTKKERFETFLAGVQGCVILDPDWVKQQEWTPAVDKFNVPFFTIMLQVQRNQKPVTKLMFVPPVKDANTRNACIEHSEDFYISYQGYDVPLRNGYIKHSIQKPQ